MADGRAADPLEFTLRWLVRGYELASHGHWSISRPPLPRRRWRGDGANLRRELIRRGKPVIEAPDSAVAAEDDRARRGQDLEGVADRGSPREIDLQDAQRFAEAGSDGFDRRMLRGPTRGAARRREHDQGRPSVGRFAECIPQTAGLAHLETLDAAA